MRIRVRGQSAWNWSIAVGLVGALGTVAGSGRAEAQAIAFQPGVATIPDGVSLDAIPAVSADRRYVRLSLNVNFQTVNSIQNFSVPFAVSGLGSGQGGAGAGGAAGGLLGTAMGMNGAVGTGAGGGAGAGAGASGPSLMGQPQPLQSWAGSPSFDGSYPTDDGSWYAPPRRVKPSRVKSARPKEPTVAAPAPSTRKPSP